MKIQKQGIKTAAEVVADGGTIADLPNDDQIYVTANSLNKSLKQAIIDGDFASPVPVILTIENANCSSSFSSGNYTIIAFGAATIDTDSGWNGTDTYTVPTGKGGYYFVDAAMFYVPGGGNTSSGIMIYINGSLRYQIFSEDPASTFSAHASQIFNLAAGDTIAIYMYTQFSGSPPAFAGGQGQLNIHKL